MTNPQNRVFVLDTDRKRLTPCAACKSPLRGILRSRKYANEPAPSSNTARSQIFAASFDESARLPNLICARHG
jgi:hypothetical protein